jgi:hypothetical protein
VNLKSDSDRAANSCGQTYSLQIDRPVMEKNKP